MIEPADQYIFVPTVIEAPVIRTMNPRHIEIRLGCDKISAVIDAAIGGNPGVVAHNAKVLVVDVQIQWPAHIT